MKKKMTRREWGVLAAVLVGLLVVAQVLPVGAPRDNPPVTGEPAWNSPATRTLFYRACADCHSNQTVWPWYSHVAPVSWLVAHDVAGGREHLNVSEWTAPQEHAKDAAEELAKGEMPLAIYLPLHPEARLSPAEQAELVAGLEATFGREGEGRGEGRGGEREDDDD